MQGRGGGLHAPKHRLVRQEKRVKSSLVGLPERSVWAALVLFSACFRHTLHPSLLNHAVNFLLCLLTTSAHSLP